MIATAKSAAIRPRPASPKCCTAWAFTDADFSAPVAEFSGGWRVRLNLARALSCRADLLLLDEPTNHLDLDAVFWLETWLKNTPATLLLISHDRDFLDAVVGQILAIDLQRLSLTTGGYSDYERARAARLATQQSAYEAQQREDRPPQQLHRPLPRQGHQGPPGAKPDQDAGAHGNGRRRPRRFALPFQLPRTERPARPAAEH
jgi:ATPase subunit of ABC transporter with duplicated ATPase domains